MLLGYGPQDAIVFMINASLRCFWDTVLKMRSFLRSTQAYDTFGIRSSRCDRFYNQRKLTMLLGYGPQDAIVFTINASLRCFWDTVRKMRSFLQSTQAYDAFGIRSARCDRFYNQRKLTMLLGYGPQDAIVFTINASLQCFWDTVRKMRSFLQSTQAYDAFGIRSARCDRFYNQRKLTMLLGYGPQDAIVFTINASLRCFWDTVRKMRSFLRSTQAYDAFGKHSPERL